MEEQSLAERVAVAIEQTAVAVKDQVAPLQFIVVDDEGVEQPHPTLPDSIPDWAMPLSTHHATMQRTAVYRCTDPACEGEHEEYRTSPRDLPYAKICGCIREVGAQTASEDGSIEHCTAIALRRTTYPGEGVALNARRFDPLVIYERANHENLGRSQNRFFFPGRNNEPTEPGMKRIEITDIASYNKVVKQINEYETQKMQDHREMHRIYWGARRTAMREDRDARQGPIRYHPLIQYLRRAIRKRSDRKSDLRYGKLLDAHFHAQLIEFNQGNMQDWCDADTGWKSRRAK